MSKVDHYIQGWLRHRLVLLDLLDKVSEEYVAFQPTETSMPLARLAVHIATSGDMFVQALKTGKFVRLEAPPKPETMEETRALVRAITDRNRAEMAEFSDQTLEKIIIGKEIFGFDAPGSVWLGSMREHEIHHKGQMFVYVRMTGVTELPFFMKTDL
ncbi:MAG: hypothetical protein A2201_06430 [Alicyclobacillus sp. RIFOXYA1_FULL_53_8]|nr:MAG: hypothetical protein A2201_06430 [Alicyclobacillus sp. RIFOXYA1_FULL_53_8]